MPLTIEPSVFVSVVRPLLESNNLQGLVEALRQRWDCKQISRLLIDGDRDARKVALVCLAMVGERACIDSIAGQLSDADRTINQMAEHALWSIWFRHGTAEANVELCRGTKALGRRELDLAIEHFDRAILLDPRFAEPHNQRAITLFLQDRFEESIGDCRKAIRLMPCHFGALAGMGHSFLHLGQLDHAIRAYRRAIVVNPHLDGVRQTLEELTRGNVKRES
jgi:tetratricopeptide (TPR) repeat protein